MNKKNSIVQIARDAKCSTAAISRYFNDGYVSAELKERIKKSIDKLGYVLSPIARLMRGQSNEIFIVCDPKELSINKNIVPVIIDNKKKEENVFVSYCDYECGNYFDCLLNIINRKPKAIIIINHTNDGEFFKFIIDYQKEANFYILGGKNNKA
ncbi:MAG: LacI family DNA-binding transcriptional regulator [Oscillospiraceae bacterium]